MGFLGWTAVSVAVIAVAVVVFLWWVCGKRIDHLETTVARLDAANDSLRKSNKDLAAAHDLVTAENVKHVTTIGNLHKSLELADGVAGQKNDAAEKVQRELAEERNRAALLVQQAQTAAQERDEALSKLGYWKEQATQARAAATEKAAAKKPASEASEEAATAEIKPKTRSK